MSGAICPTCGQEIPSRQPVSMTDRELDVLSAWWHSGTVKRAAMIAGVGEQRAKNMLARARLRNGVATNAELVSAFLDQLRPLKVLLAQHNKRVRDAA